MNLLPTELSDRPAAAEDEDFLFRVYASTRVQELAALGWPAAQLDAFLRMQYNLRKQSYSAYAGAAYSILLSGGSPAGSAIVWRGGHEIRLVDIALLPEFRNCGAGTEWISRLIRESRQAGVPLRLSVVAANPARRLYERLGFVAQSAGSMYIEMEHYGSGAE